jgi:hypothetical protein
VRVRVRKPSPSPHLRGKELSELYDLVCDERVALLALRCLLEDDELRARVRVRVGVRVRV